MFWFLLALYCVFMWLGGFFAIRAYTILYPIPSPDESDYFGAGVMLFFMPVIGIPLLILFVSSNVGVYLCNVFGRAMLGPHEKPQPPKGITRL